MFTLSRKTDYALVAMADLARRSPATLSARDIAKRLNLPLPALQNILTQLTHHELVVSIRGPRGGYRLSRPAERINVAEVIAAVGGPLRLALCCEGGAEMSEDECQMEGACAIREPVRMVDRLLRRCLGEITLAQLTWNRVPLALPPAASSRHGLIDIKCGGGESPGAEALETGGQTDGEVNYAR